MVWDGIFAAYMTGVNGQGFAMFVFTNGTVVGADPLGVRFTGTYLQDNDGRLTGNMTVTVPPNQTVIQGVSTGASSMTYEVPIKLLCEAESGAVFSVDTPLGSVNVRLEKLSNLNGMA